MEDYPVLARCLDYQAIRTWFREDLKDDFFYDPIHWRDLLGKFDDFLEDRKHSMLQLDQFPAVADEVPKRGDVMVREGLWLHPVHRLVYLAILHVLLPLVDPKIPPRVYSYRDDRADGEGYPFQNRLERWKHFYNDFRNALLSEDVGAVVITDLAAFYDHISITKLESRVRSIIGAGIPKEADACLNLLTQLLNRYSTTGFGIPQNYDPSSFLGSVYLYNTDADIIGKRYSYFRWVDDIRICCKHKKQALRAIHDLQRSLAADRLFLNSAKTKIILKGESQFEELLDVSDDVTIAEIEDAIRAGSREAMDGVYDRMLERVRYHAGEDGDDRRFRAFANRMIDMGMFREYHERVSADIRALVLNRLDSHPAMTDYWAKMLRPFFGTEQVDDVWRLLVTDPSVFNWQRYHLWHFLAICDVDIAQDRVEHALQRYSSVPSPLEASMLSIFVGRKGTNDQRERLFTSHFNQQLTYVQQRAVLIAVQELPKSLRSKLYGQAVLTGPQHKRLVEYLQGLDIPDYGPRPRPLRTLPVESRKPVARLKQGVGKVDGRVTRFRLSARHVDYE